MSEKKVHEQIRLLWETLLIREDEPPEKIGAIVAPGAVTYRPTSGVVLALGEGASGGFQVGDRVIFQEYAGNRYEFDGEPLKILSESEVLAVIPRGATPPRGADEGAG